ncbi:uridine kinase [Bacillus pseudomycoides]|nr:uridine kinase [Bacillus pseudomycoides]PEM40009.1 uridine kinase [Bacillus pseudomycoides]PGE96833.1 uridine kinase [Bacillus pseudomycoides]PHA80287.1 uridine kinase [Bacillus pseudomycoides]PHB30058.1 uridine kinase [Bacillus pseudomycoides]
MELNRQTIIREIVERIFMVKLDHPLRVGVSGITASGKTTFANELQKEIHLQGGKAVRTSIDNFHNPRIVRYSQGKESAKGYYEDAHDYKAFAERLLIPLGPGGDMRYDMRSHDLETDMYIEPDPILASKDMVFIIDGTFLLKKELQHLFDYKIFVETDFEIARERGSSREAKNFWNKEKAERMFLQRYHAACHMYIEEHGPKECAEVVLINNDIEAPKVLFKSL